MSHLSTSPATSWPPATFSPISATTTTTGWGTSSSGTTTGMPAAAAALSQFDHHQLEELKVAGLDKLAAAKHIGGGGGVVKRLEKGGGKMKGAAGAASGAGAVHRVPRVKQQGTSRQDIVRDINWGVTIVANGIKFVSLIMTIMGGDNDRKVDRL